MQSTHSACGTLHFSPTITMNGYTINLEDATKENDKFRKVLYTGKHSQLVLMSLNPGEEIGEEVHTLDQFIRIEQGEAKAVIDGATHSVGDGDGIIIPAGARHNFINTSKTSALKLYTIYSPPEHRDGKVHATKTDAQNDASDEFDGRTTE